MCIYLLKFKSEKTSQSEFELATIESTGIVCAVVSVKRNFTLNKIHIYIYMFYISVALSLSLSLSLSFPMEAAKKESPLVIRPLKP